MISIPDLRLFQRKMIQFIWGDKRPRVNKCTLFAPKTRGGLGAPDLIKYYYAAQISHLIRYHSQEPHPIWMQLESKHMTRARFNTRCG